MTAQNGGCLCGGLRYRTISHPLRVTICHCRFCQRATGSAYMVEPIFRLQDLTVNGGEPAVFKTTSQGSGKWVKVHFCPTCGTKLFLSFERFPDVYGVYAGTFDDPNWFAIGPENSKHIFISAARHETLIPPGISTFEQHAIDNEGRGLSPVVFDSPQRPGRRG
ncbi:GFA family protein [Alsobacter sp. SYSU BS001988]